MYDRLHKDTFYLLAAQTFDKLTGVFLLVVLSRCLPAGDIGTYYFALSFAGTFIILSNLNLNPVLMRRVARDRAHASVHLSSLLGFRVLSAPIYLLCVTVASIALAKGVWQVIVIVALITLLENFYFSFGRYFLAMRKVSYNVSIGVTVQIFFLIVFLLGMWWAPSLRVLLEANLVRSLCLLGAACFVTFRWLSPLRVSWDSGLIKEGSPFVLLTVVNLFRGKVDTLLLGFLTDYATVGHYNLALRIIFASFFVSKAVGAVFFPQLAAHGLIRKNRRDLIHRAGFLFGLGLLGTVVAFVCAESIARLLYDSLAGPVTLLLRPMSLLIPVSFLHLFFSTSLQALGQEKKVLLALAISTGLGFIANCALIPLVGAYGAVCAHLASALIQLAILALYLFALFKRTESKVA